MLTATTYTHAYLKTLWQISYKSYENTTFAQIVTMLHFFFYKIPFMWTMPKKGELSTNLSRTQKMYVSSSIMRFRIHDTKRHDSRQDIRFRTSSGN